MPMLITAAAIALTAQDYVPDVDCMAPAHFLWVENKPARQGETIAIRAKRYEGGERDEPEKCISDWKVSDPNIARLSTDHRSVMVAEDAPPGTVVTISYDAEGKRSAELRVVAKDALVLTGTYRQTGLADCYGDAIGELEFRANGRFSVTFHPFESYADYWGSYRWDAASGALTLAIDGGNKRDMTGTLEGTARRDADGKLHLDGFMLGNVAPQTAGRKCSYTFG